MNNSPLKLISYNVNGFRAAIKNGFWDWCDALQPDIICLQETKATPDQLPLDEIAARGYQHHWHSAETKGYSGEAILTRRAPDIVVAGCGIARYDTEGRVIRADFGDVTLLNCYFPSGTSGDLRQAVKYDFLADFQAWVQELRKERPKLIIVGDYNIAHQEADIHNPRSNKNTSGFLPEERAWFSNWLASGFIDAFRTLNPNQIQYSWWSYRAGARQSNKGWRIDYICLTENLQTRLAACQQLNDAVHSDHCPVLAEINI